MEHVHIDAISLNVRKKKKNLIPCGAVTSGNMYKIVEIK